MSIFRRIMLGGGIDITSLPETRKLYYKATAKVSPKSGSLGSPIIKNSWDSATDEGIIVCSKDILIIGKSAFFSNISLTSVPIPDGVIEIGNYAFSGCRSLTNVTIPDSVTSIGELAFEYCESLTSVTIPNSVTTIKMGTFLHCYNLTSVPIPDGVIEIGGSAFCYCSSLKSVTIPNSVTTIGNQAFSKCYSLTSVYCKATTPPVLGGTSVFDNNGSGRKIYVSAESVDAYKSAEYWSEYADAIIGYDFENNIPVE